MVRAGALHLPASKSRLVVLGKRLAKGTPGPGDHELYVQMLDVYDLAQRAVRDILERQDWSLLGISETSVSGRTKTLDTLVQKLQRSPRTQLPYIRDIAGVRLVADMTLLEQDVLARSIATIFERDGRPSALIDRINEPVSGYRARHVVVYVDDIPVEIQVRTRLQHLWAEMYERLADLYGRQIRYGEAPDPDPEPVAADSWTRQEMVEAMIALSLGPIATVERDTSNLGLTRAALDPESLIGEQVREAAGLAFEPAEAERQLTLTEDKHRELVAARQELEHALVQIMQALSAEETANSARATLEGL